MNYLYLIIFALVGGLFSLAGGVLLMWRKKTAQGLVRVAPAFAAGALLSAVFLDILSKGLESYRADLVLWGTLAGVVGFFFFERFIHWFHHKSDHAHAKDTNRASLVVAGDTLHNFIDGIAIASAFLISVPTGIITSIVVALHEIPHEIGDIGVLMSKGISKRKVLIINALSSLATLVGALLFYQIGQIGDFGGLLTGISAGFLLYVALSDLVPSIQVRSKDHALSTRIPYYFVAGLVSVGLAVQIAHGLQPHEEGHDHHGDSHMQESHKDEDEESHAEEDHHE